jgi:hypothetical protein
MELDHEACYRALSTRDARFERLDPVADRIQQQETGGGGPEKLSLLVPHQYRITDNHDRRT